MSAVMELDVARTIARLAPDAPPLDDPCAAVLLLVRATLERSRRRPRDTGEPRE